MHLRHLHFIHRCYIYRKKRYANTRELEDIESTSPPPAVKPSSLQASSEMLHTKSTDMLVENNQYDPLPDDNTYDQLPAMQPTIIENDYDQLPALKGKT